LVAFGRNIILIVLKVIALFYAMSTQSFAATCGPATAQGAAPAAWQTYCWIDMSSYNSATVFGGGQGFAITLSDGSVLSFTLSGISPSGTSIRAAAAPAWTGAATGNSAFLGIPGQPILYTTTGGTVDLTLSNIKVTPPNGVVSTGQYKFVVADAESSNNGESLRFITDGAPWEEVDQVPPTTGAIYPTISGTGTSTFNVTGVAGTVGAYIMGSLSPETVQVRLVAGGLQGIMLAVQYSSVVINKQISGARANAADQFTYGIKATSNGSNLSSGTSTGAGSGPFGTAVATLSSSVATTLYEEMAPGSVSTLAQYNTSLTCTNGAAGSPTALPVAQPVASYNVSSTNYGDAISCTFTNTAKPATVAVRKITVGAIGGAFTFTSTNLAAAPAAITTTATNTATPAVPTAIAVTTLNTAVTITEAPGTKFAPTAVSCTDASAAITGNPASFGTLAGNVLTIPAVNIVAAAQITCTITNMVLTATAATVAIQKITTGAAGGPFSFAVTNLTLAPAAITTTTAGTAYPIVTAPIAATANGAQVRITETLAANYTIVSASCTDANAAASGNPVGSFGTRVGNQLTIAAANIRARAQITCVFTNIVNPAIPVVAVQKITTLLPGGPFSFTATNLAGTPANISTTAAATAAPVVPNYISVTSITTPVTLTEAANTNFNLSNGSCIDTNAVTTGNPASFGTFAGSVITVPVANLLPFAKIVCTFTNTPKQPTVVLQKITSGAFGGPFSFTATNLVSAYANISTTVANTATPVVPVAIQVTAANTNVQITEAANTRFTPTSATCSDANATFTGNPASFGSLTGNVLTVPAANVVMAARIICSMTNTAIPATVSLQKISSNVAGGPFNFSVSNLATTPAAITTAGAGTPTPVAPTAMTVSALNSAVQISEATNTFFSLSGAICTDANSAVSGNTGTFGTLTGQLLTIPAANVLPAAQITCTFTNIGDAPKLKLQKALAGTGRIAAADQFRLSVTGTGAPAAVNTTGAGAAITSAPISFTATANTAYALTETMAPGSASFIVAYTQTAACLNNNATGTSVSGINSVPINITVQAADDISCVITNNGSPTPNLIIDKSYTTASTPVVVGQTVTYTYTITNTGNVSINNVQVADMHGSPAALIPVGASGITGETLTVPGPLGAGVSPDTTANDGIWSTLGPGATIRFIYNHTVTQAEIDNG
jgi:uncharacterized repeat protein (TIGR01451 family)